MTTLQRIKCVVLMATLYFAHASTAMAQGNNFGLGNQDEKELQSLSNRLLNLEERSKFFQVYMNFRGGYSETLDKEERGGKFEAAHIRPEFLGDLGKFGYRVRLDLGGNHNTNSHEGTNNVIDILRLFYNPNERWSFSFGKSALNYGTFEFDWNPVHVLQYYEFQGMQPGINAVSVTAGYEVNKQLFTLEAANASTATFFEDYPSAAGQFTKSKHPLQYSLSWRGEMLDSRLKTIWSYTLRNEAKGCHTNLFMLGTSYNFGKLEAQLDYNAAIGKLDYLGLATEDARQAGIIGADDIVTDTRYQQWVVDLGYRPTKRWNLFVKAGVNCSSVKGIEQLNHYRKTYEYSAVAQYYLDKSQDLRLSLGYFGKSINYKDGIGLSNANSNRIELSIVTRLKIL